MLSVSRLVRPCPRRLSVHLLPSSTTQARFISDSTTNKKAASPVSPREVAPARSDSAPRLSSDDVESSVARGTRYEHLCLEVLRQMFGMELERTGGAGDRGIDLRGWWVPKAAADQEHSRQRIRILAQCKCQDEGGKKMGPVLIREMEGVMLRNASSTTTPPFDSDSQDQTQVEDAPLAGVILSSSGFSKQALLQVRSSNVPLVAMHVLAQSQAEAEAEAEKAASARSHLADRCVAVVWNDRFGAPNQGLLDGGLEVRWVRTLSARSNAKDGGAGRPVIYRNGEPLR